MKDGPSLDRLLDDEDLEIHDFLALTPELLRLTYKKQNQTNKHPITNNVPLGVFVTSYARLHLYSYMRKIGARLLYVGKCVWKKMIHWILTPV